MKLFLKQLPFTIIFAGATVALYSTANSESGFFDGLALLVSIFIFAFLLCYLLENELKENFARIIAFLGSLSDKDFSSEMLDSSIQNLDSKLYISLEELSESLASQFEVIESEKNQLETILGAMSEGVIVVSDKGQILMINNSAKKMFQVEHKSVNRPYWELIRNKGLQNLISRSQQKRETIKEEISIIYPEERYYIANVESINTPSKDTIIVIFDITEFKKLEKIKADFIANVSHELRTPLTSMKGYVETLIDEAYDSPLERNNFLGVIDKNTNRLISLVSDLLILSELEGKGHLVSNESKKEFEMINVKEVIFHSFASVEPKILGKNIEEKIEIDENTDLIMGDKFLIEQMLTNLIDNAVKYTPENGKVTVRAYPQNGSVVIEVEDSGIGIPKKHHDRIFERFYRVNKDRSREMGGTGLGLSIVKHTVLQHGGSIKLESEEQRGTKFTIKLPVEVNPENIKPRQLISEL